MPVSLSLEDGPPCPCCALWKFSGHRIGVYGYGYIQRYPRKNLWIWIWIWEISYPRQAWWSAKDVQFHNRSSPNIAYILITNLDIEQHQQQPQLHRRRRRQKQQQPPADAGRRHTLHAACCGRHLTTRNYDRFRVTTATRDYSCMTHYHGRLCHTSKRNWEKF